jgi:hypothetical protein
MVNPRISNRDTRRILASAIIAMLRDIFIGTREMSQRDLVKPTANQDNKKTDRARDTLVGVVDYLDKAVGHPCLQCHQVITKSIRWYRDNPGDPCPNCGKPIFIAMEGDVPKPLTDDPTKAR